MTAGDSILHRRLRAPRDHATTLVEPPLATAGDLLRRNGARRAGDLAVHGWALRNLQADARRELLALARAYSAQYLSPPPDAFDVWGAAAASTDVPAILMTGHQPQLYHPGVWFKNFALSSLAAHLRVVPVNLLIDNDTLRTATIRVPTGTPRAPRVELVAMDAPGEEIPYEERNIRDATVWNSFGDRATAVVQPLIPRPMLTAWWPEACSLARREPNLGRCLAAARHRCESSWGLRTLELPLSSVCETRAFRWFATHLLDELPRLHELYNEALAEYRRVHRLRGTSHPVPNLARDGDWFEAPFWIWTASHPRRRRAFVRRRGGQLEVSDRGVERVVLDVPPTGDLSRAVEQWADWSRNGGRFRPRALMTTMYARLVLSDLFLHGIGGAKYDQLTDALLRRFFRLSPPDFVTLTATVQLPIQHEVVTTDDVRHTQWMLRDLWFHPERHLSELLSLENGGSSTPTKDRDTIRSELAQLVATKRRWLADDAPRGSRLRRHRALLAVNEQLRQHVVGLRKTWLARRDAHEAAHKRHALLASREFAFCLFPAEELRRLLLELSSVAP